MQLHSTIEYSLENQVAYNKDVLKKAISYILKVDDLDKAYPMLAIPTLLMKVAEYHFTHEHVRLSHSVKAEIVANYVMAIHVCRCAAVDLEKFGEFVYQDNAQLSFFDEDSVDTSTHQRLQLLSDMNELKGDPTFEETTDTNNINGEF